MITSLIEILELTNFGHVTTPIISFEPRDKILLVTSWTENIMYISKYLYSKKM